MFTFTLSLSYFSWKLVGGKQGLFYFDMILAIAQSGMGKQSTQFPQRIYISPFISKLDFRGEWYLY